MDYFKVFEHQVDGKLRKLIDEPVNEDLIKKNKYANNSSYVPETVYRRILNKISNYQWSFVPHEVTTIKDDKGKPYVQYIGLLIIPGYGIHTGIGTQTLEKKDNSNATAAAKTYAFKNACKEMGLAPNIANEDHDEELFENIDDKELDSIEEKPKKKSAKKEKPKKKSSKKEETKKAADKQPSKKKKSAMTLEEKVEEVREAYELKKDDDFVAFIQIWDEDILDIDDMDDDDWEDFLDYLEENKEEFEEF
jgi:hypothetical protein